MQQEHILVDQWQNFCRRFSAQHAGWRIDIEVILTEVLTSVPLAGHARAHKLADNVTFRRIEAEPRGNDTEVSITVSDDSIYKTYQIPQTARIILEKASSASGVDSWLRIDDTAGTTKLLCFRIPHAHNTSPMHPDQ
jgi:hypothetical protein